MKAIQSALTNLNGKPDGGQSDRAGLVQVKVTDLRGGRLYGTTGDGGVFVLESLSTGSVQLGQVLMGQVVGDRVVVNSMPR